MRDKSLFRKIDFSDSDQDRENVCIIWETIFSILFCVLLRYTRARKIRLNTFIVYFGFAFFIIILKNRVNCFEAFNQFREVFCKIYLVYIPVTTSSSSSFSRDFPWNRFCPWARSIISKSEWNVKVCRNIYRRTDFPKISSDLTRLTICTSVYLDIKAYSESRLAPCRLRERGTLAKIPVTTRINDAFCGEPLKEEERGKKRARRRVHGMKTRFVPDATRYDATSRNLFLEGIHGMHTGSCA